MWILLIAGFLCLGFICSKLALEGYLFSLFGRKLDFKSRGPLFKSHLGWEMCFFVHFMFLVSFGAVTFPWNWLVGRPAREEHGRNLLFYSCLEWIVYFNISSLSCYNCMYMTTYKFWSESSPFSNWGEPVTHVWLHLHLPDSEANNDENEEIWNNFTITLCIKGEYFTWGEECCWQWWPPWLCLVWEFSRSVCIQEHISQISSPRQALNWCSRWSFSTNSIMDE